MQGFDVEEITLGQPYASWFNFTYKMLEPYLFTMFCFNNFIT